MSDGGCSGGKRDEPDDRAVGGGMRSVHWFTLAYYKLLLFTLFYLLSLNFWIIPGTKTYYVIYNANSYFLQCIRGNLTIETRRHPYTLRVPIPSRPVASLHEIVTFGYSMLTYAIAKLSREKGWGKVRSGKLPFILWEYGKR